METIEELSMAIGRIIAHYYNARMKIDEPLKPLLRFTTAKIEENLKRFSESSAWLEDKKNKICRARATLIHKDWEEHMNCLLQIHKFLYTDLISKPMLLSDEIVDMVRDEVIAVLAAFYDLNHFSSKIEVAFNRERRTLKPTACFRQPNPLSFIISTPKICTGLTSFGSHLREYLLEPLGAAGFTADSKKAGEIIEAKLTAVFKQFKDTREQRAKKLEEARAAKAAKEALAATATTEVESPTSDASMHEAEEAEEVEQTQSAGGFWNTVSFGYWS